MNSIYEYLAVLLPMLCVGIFFWIISLIKKDVSIVDSLWSVFFIIIALSAVYQQEQVSDRALLLLVLVLIWGLRLSLYITVRHWGQEEDHRYQAIRKDNQPWFGFKSLYLIFGYQAIIAWIIALPIFYGIQSTTPLNLLDLLAFTLWLVGMFFETVSDHQLYRFKESPANQGKILTKGLWKYTRHPNYFGECLIWWGFFLFALSGISWASDPWTSDPWASHAWICIISPILMTVLLLKFSGVSLLEKSMKTRPGYEVYMLNTNAFIPGVPRKKGESDAS